MVHRASTSAASGHRDRRSPDRPAANRAWAKPTELVRNIVLIALAAYVFHHIPFKKHFHLIQEISRTLRYGGIFMIYEHNPYNPLTRNAVNTCPFDENAVLLRKTEVNKILKKTGLQVVTQEYRVFFPAFLKILRPSEQYLKWLPLGGQYFVIAKKY